MRDLSLMSQSVADPAVRPLVEEAIRAFSGGAHRSATVATWIAVVVDLTNKIRSLAEGGDKAAEKMVRDLDASVASHAVKDFQAFENKILEVSEKTFELLERQEAVYLSRLFEDRNMCAHPGYSSDEALFEPTAEAVRAHLVAAHDAVFGKYAVAGKRREKRLNEEIQGESWPGASQLPAYLGSRFFNGAPGTTSSNMTKLLIKSAIVPPECERPNLVARRSRQAAIARKEQDPQGFADAMHGVLTSWEHSGKLNDSALIRAVGAFGGTSEFWAELPNTAAVRAQNYIPRADLSALISGRLFVSGRPLDPDLAQAFDIRLEELDEEGLTTVLKQTITRAHLVSRAIALVGESHNFVAAAKTTNLLSEVSRYFTAADVGVLKEKIASNPDDQVRPARDVEEGLIAAFESAVVTDPDKLAAWQSLASFLVSTTDKTRYFGNHRSEPYGRFKEAVST